MKQAVDHGLRYRRLGRVLYIGIDEITRRRGHVHHTQVSYVDLLQLALESEQLSSQIRCGLACRLELSLELRTARIAASLSRAR